MTGNWVWGLSLWLFRGGEYLGGNNKLRKVSLYRWKEVRTSDVLAFAVGK